MAAGTKGRLPMASPLVIAASTIALVFACRQAAWSSAPASDSLLTAELSTYSPPRITAIPGTQPNDNQNRSPQLRPRIEPGGSTGVMSLDGALNEALANSPRMAAARKLLGIAKSSRWQASVLPNPGIYISDNFQNSYIWGGTFLTEMPWRIIFRFLAANQQIKLTNQEILKTLWQFRGEVRRLYAELVMAREMQVVREQLADLTKLLWQVSRKRFALGDVPGLDVRRANLAMLQAEIDRRQAEIRVTQAREQINIIMGRTADTSMDVPRLPDNTSSPSSSDLLPDLTRPLRPRDYFVSEGLTNRPEIRIVKQSIKTNQANLRNSLASIIPTPTFRMGQALELNPPPPLFIQRVLNFQAYIEVPTTNFQQGDIAKYIATGKQLKKELLSQQNIITSQVALAYRNVEIARAKLRIYQEQALAESNNVTQIARLSYELGEADMSTSLLAQSANIQIRSQYLDTVLAYQLALNDLEQSIGRPLEYNEK